MATDERFTATTLVASGRLIGHGGAQSQSAPTPSIPDAIARWSPSYVRDPAMVCACRSRPLQEWSEGVRRPRSKADQLRRRIPAELKAAACLHLEIGVALVGVNAEMRRRPRQLRERAARSLDRHACRSSSHPAVVNESDNSFARPGLQWRAAHSRPSRTHGRAKPLLNKALDALPQLSAHADAGRRAEGI